MTGIPHTLETTGHIMRDNPTAFGEIVLALIGVADIKLDAGQRIILQLIQHDLAKAEVKRTQYREQKRRQRARLATKAIPTSKRNKACR